MNTRVSASVLIVVLTLTHHAHAAAANTGFLKDTALAFLSEEDMKLQTATALSVLEGADARGLKEWKNPKSGARGRSQGLGNFKSSDGLHCRKLRLWVEARGIETQFSFPVCKGNDGEWFIASGKTLHRA
jgi:surface antigen